MEGLPDSLEGSEAFIFLNGTETVQRAECSCRADGRQGGHGAVYPIAASCAWEHTHTTQC